MELRLAAADAAAALAGLGRRAREPAVAELDPCARKLAVAALRKPPGDGNGVAGSAAPARACKRELADLLELVLDGDDAKSTISDAASALERQPALAEELVRSVFRVVASSPERDQAPLGRGAEPTLGAVASAPVHERASAASGSQGGDGLESAIGAASSVDISVLASAIVDAGRAHSSIGTDASSLTSAQDTTGGESALSVGWDMSAADPDERERAVAALITAAPVSGRRACRRKLDALCERLLEDDDGDVRVACAEALPTVATVAGDEGCELAVAQLCTCLKQDKDSSVMRAVTDALLSLGAGVRAAQSLCARVGEEGSSWEGRVLAACQLFRIPANLREAHHYMDALRGRCQDNNAVEERLAAAVALCALGLETGWAAPGLRCVATAAGGSEVVLTLGAAHRAIHFGVHVQGQHAAASLSEFESGADHSETLLHVAASSDSEDAVVALLEARAALDLQAANRFTPLHFAAQRGHAQFLSALLEASAALDLQAADGATPLHLAAHEGHAQVLSALLEARAALDLQAAHGFTPLHLAAHEGHAQVLSALLAASAALDLRAAHGATPLHLAAQEGHAQVLSALLEARAAVDLQRPGGFTPLHLAAHEGHTQVLSALLEASAALGLQAAHGRPLDLAAYHGHAQVVSKLLEARVALDLQRSDGEAPLLTATRGGHSEVVLALQEARRAIDL